MAMRVSRRRTGHAQPEVPDHVRRRRSTSFSMISWYAMIRTGVARDRLLIPGPPACDDAAHGHGGAVAGETSFGPAGMSCVNRAMPDAYGRSLAVLLRGACGDLVAAPRGSFAQHLADRQRPRSSLRADRLEDSSVNPSLPTSRGPRTSVPAPPGPRTSIRRQPSLSTNPGSRCPCLWRCARCSASLASFSGTGRPSWPRPASRLRRTRSPRGAGQRPRGSRTTKRNFSCVPPLRGVGDPRYNSLTSGR